MVGLGRLKKVHVPNKRDETWFDLVYLTAYLETPLTIEGLRADPVVGDASFLKAGAAGTVFPLTKAEAARLLRLARQENSTLRGFAWGASGRPTVRDAPRALSIRQPWAELILRGEKTIEARSLRTNVRGRVHIYASLGEVSAENRARVATEYELDIDRLPRGVLVGTVEIVGCRPLIVRDSRAAAFRVSEETTSFAWLLASPKRATHLIKPARHPQPVFFRPF
jgi:hypothetical protein